MSRAGGLPSQSVLSRTVDREGLIWLGTEEGVCYFADPLVFSSGVNAIRPIFETRFLLRDDRVTAIAVDGVIESGWELNVGFGYLVHQVKH